MVEMSGLAHSAASCLRMMNRERGVVHDDVVIEIDSANAEALCN